VWARKPAFGRVWRLCPECDLWNASRPLGPAFYRYELVPEGASRRAVRNPVSTSLRLRRWIEALPCTPLASQHGARRRASAPHFLLPLAARPRGGGLFGEPWLKDSLPRCDKSAAAPLRCTSAHAAAKRPSRAFLAYNAARLRRQS